MKKFAAVLFGLLVVAAGLAAATQWAVTSVHQYKEGTYGWAYAEVDIKYDTVHPYTNFQVTYRGGNVGLTDKGKQMGYTTRPPQITYPDNYSVSVTCIVVDPATGMEVERVTATAGVSDI